MTAANDTSYGPDDRDGRGNLDCPCEQGREAAMVTLAPGIWCDPCIAPIVRALNEGGVLTVASCCGHRANNGSIVLADGRELRVYPDVEGMRPLRTAADHRDAP